MEDVVQTEHNEKSVSSDLIRGHINTIILRALYDGDKYGYEIIAEIERKSHGQYSLKQPSLYSALKRLEKDGYITSYWGGSVGGGRRKYFSVTETGKAISEQNQSEWEYSRTVIDSLISDKDFDFSNPAPSLVNMRVLKKSTSRVPRAEGEDEELDYLPAFDENAEFDQLEESYQEKISEQRAAFDVEIRTRTEELTKEYESREQELAAREQALRDEHTAIEEKNKQLEAREQAYDERVQMLEKKEQELNDQLAHGESLAKEYDWREQELSAREKSLGELKEQLCAESEQAKKLQESREQELAERERQLEEQAKALQEQAQQSQLDAQRSELATKTLQELSDQRAAFDEEIRTRNEALLKERDWREQELTAREQTLSQKYAELENRNQTLLKEYDWREREISTREQALSTLRTELDARNQSLEQQFERREAEILIKEQEVSAQREELTLQSEREATQQEQLLREQMSSLEAQLKENQAALDDAQRLAEERLINPEAEEQRERISQLEEDCQSLSQQLEEEKSACEALLEEQRKKSEELLEEERQKTEALIADERQRNEFLLETERHRADSAIAAEQNSYNNRLEAALAQERANYEAALKAQEERIIAEQAELFRKQEHALMQRNYLELLNAPTTRQQPRDYNHYTTPAPPQRMEESPAESYRSVVQRLYANAAAPADPTPNENARSLDGMDFTDLESRAEKDGIRIATTGGKQERLSEETESMVNKGKALFLSGITFCAFCIALGAVLLGLSASVAIPVFFPYLIWGVGFAVLLVTGLAFANRYGAKSLRTSSPTILNSIITYILLIIVTLIIALAAKADFSDQLSLNGWVTIPIIAYLGVIVFGVVYYLQVRPKKDSPMMQS